MPQPLIEVTNPGLVNVVAQGDGPTSVDQPVTVGPTQVSGRTVKAGSASPQSSRTRDVTANNVVGQVFGLQPPANVFV